MLLATTRRRVAAWRQPLAAARIARVLWVVWALLLWNVVFDHVIVVAGREYIAAARRAAVNPRGPFANMDDWMRPAVVHGVWIATAAGGAVLVTGLAAINGAVRRAERSGDHVAVHDQDHPR
jgi:hypothetical protein